MPAIIGLALLAIPLVWVVRHVLRLLLIVVLGAAVLIGGLIAADLLVDTDREQIESVMEQVVQAGLAENAESIGYHLHPDFQGEAAGRKGPSRRLTILVLEGFFNTVEMEQLEVKDLKITMNADKSASAYMELLFEAKGPGIMAANSLPMNTQWDLVLVKDDTGRWVIKSAILKQINGKAL